MDYEGESLEFAWKTEEKYEQLQSGKPESWLRFDKEPSE
jgi:hypothetical protein